MHWVGSLETPPLNHGGPDCCWCSLIESSHHQKEMVEEGSTHQLNLLIRTGLMARNYRYGQGQLWGTPAASLEKTIPMTSSRKRFLQLWLMHKKIHILTSNGIAPNNDTVFELLKSLSDPPITTALPTSPAVKSNSLWPLRLTGSAYSWCFGCQFANINRQSALPGY